MSEWLVRFEGHNFDLEELPGLFILPGLEVIEENGDRYYKVLF